MLYAAAGRITGVDLPVHIHAWHLRGQEALRRRLGGHRATTSSLATRLSALAGARAGSGPAETALGWAAERGLSLLDRATTTNAGLGDVAGGALSPHATLHHVVVVVPWSTDAVRLTPADPRAAASA